MGGAKTKGCSGGLGEGVAGREGGVFSCGGFRRFGDGFSTGAICWAILFEGCANESEFAVCRVSEIREIRAIDPTNIKV